MSEQCKRIFNWNILGSCKKGADVKSVSNWEPFWYIWCYYGLWFEVKERVYDS